MEQLEASFWIQFFLGYIPPFNFMRQACHLLLPLFVGGNLPLFYNNRLSLLILQLFVVILYCPYRVNLVLSGFYVPYFLGLFFTYFKHSLLLLIFRDLNLLLTHLLLLLLLGNVLLTLCWLWVLEEYLVVFMAAIGIAILRPVSLLISLMFVLRLNFEVLKTIIWNLVTLDNVICFISWLLFLRHGLVIWLCWVPIISDGFVLLWKLIYSYFYRFDWLYWCWFYVDVFYLKFLFQTFELFVGLIFRSLETRCRLGFSFSTTDVFINIFSVIFVLDKTILSVSF